MLHSIWPTKIKIKMLELTEAENDELAAIALEFSTQSMNRSGLFKFAVPRNILINNRSPVVMKFFGELKTMLAEYLLEGFDLRYEDISNVRFNTWGNVERATEWSIPHGHYSNQVVITYYPKIVRAPDECDRAGRLVFHNPKPLIPAFMAHKERPIWVAPLQSGTLIAFPGNAAHSTFPFFQPGSEKFALITNIRFSSNAEPPEQEVYREEEDIVRAQTGEGR